MQLQCVAVEPRSTISGISKTDKESGALVSASGSDGAIVDLVFNAEIVEVTRDGRVRVKVADASAFVPGATFELLPVVVEEVEPAPAEEPAPEPAPEPVATSAE